MVTPKVKLNNFGVVHHSPLELLAIIPATLKVHVDAKAKTIEVTTGKVPALFYFEATDKIPSNAKIIDADTSGNRTPLTHDVVQKCLGVKI